MAPLYLGSCNNSNSGQPEKIETLNVFQPIRVDTVFTKEYVAEIHSLQNVEIRTHVRGLIEKIHVDEGKPVSKGQVLFTLGSREFQENLLKATANYKSVFSELKVAEVALKNTRTLAERKIVSQSELDMAVARKEAIEAKLEEARIAISIAELNLSFTRVKAPFTGVINRIPNKVGSLVDEGALLTTISNNDEVFAYFNVSEKEFLEYKKQGEGNKLDHVRLLMTNNEMFRYDGKVETVENEIDAGTGNIAFRARFKNPEHLLKHGSSGRIQYDEKLQGALIIPQKSTFEIQDKTYVYVVNDSNRVLVKNIVPKFRLNHLFVVESGISTTDKIIYEGLQKVRAGQQVKSVLIPFHSLKFN
ncbi:MAG: hypothetical protein RLY16_102 [Bacteroidota bacterium]